MAARRRTALAAVVVSAACFGTLAILAPLAYRAWPGGEQAASPLTLLAWRFLVATVLLAGYQLLRDPRSLLVSRRELARYATIALTGYALASICFFFALRYASAPVVAILLYTYPAMVALVGWAGGELFNRVRLAGILAAFLGCVLVLDPFSATGGVQPVGIALGLGAAVGYTRFTLLSHKWMEGRSGLVVMTYMLGFSGVAIGITAEATGSGLSVAGWGADLWLALGGLVLIPTFAAIVLYLESMKTLGATQASVISTLEPLVTIVLAWAVLGQTLGALQLGGAALVLAGVVASETGARHMLKEPPAGAL